MAIASDTMNPIANSSRLVATCGQSVPAPTSVTPAFQIAEGVLNSDLRKSPLFAAISHASVNPTNPITP